MKMLAVPMLLLCSAVHAGFTSDAELREQNIRQAEQKNLEHIEAIKGQQVWVSKKCSSPPVFYAEPPQGRLFRRPGAAFYNLEREVEPITVIDAQRQPDGYLHEILYTVKMADGSQAYYRSTGTGDWINPVPPTTIDYGCWFTSDPVAYREELRKKQKADEAARAAAYQAEMAEIRKRDEESARKRAALAKKPGVRIGMTKRQVIRNSSWGEPMDVNSTTTASGTFEQWVYGDGNYLYFRNGILVSIQN